MDSTNKGTHVIQAAKRSRPMRVLRTAHTLTLAHKALARARAEPDALTRQYYYDAADSLISGLVLVLKHPAAAVPEELAALAERLEKELR